MNTYYTDNIVVMSFTSVRLIVSANTEIESRKLFDKHISIMNKNDFYKGKINLKYSIKRLKNRKVKSFFCEG